MLIMINSQQKTGCALQPVHRHNADHVVYVIEQDQLHRLGGSTIVRILALFVNAFSGCDLSEDHYDLLKKRSVLSTTVPLCSVPVHVFGCALV